LRNRRDVDARFAATRRVMPETPERDDFSSNRHPALSFCLSMIFSENRCPLFRIMLEFLHVAEKGISRSPVGALWMNALLA
jgi:hypothetical protein